MTSRRRPAHRAVAAPWCSDARPREGLRQHLPGQRLAPRQQRRRGQIVTAAPRPRRPRHLEPTTPPPSTSSRRGAASALVASRLVHGRASRRPGAGGTVAGAGGHHDGVPGGQRPGAPSGAGDLDGPLAAEPPVPADEGDAGAAPATPPGRRPARAPAKESRRANTAAGSSSPVSLPGQPAGPPAAPPGAAAPCSACRPSTSTRRRPARARRAPRTARPGRPVGDVLPGRAGADHDDVVRVSPVSSFAARPRRMAEMRKKMAPGMA